MNAPTPRPVGVVHVPVNIDENPYARLFSATSQRSGSSAGEAES